MHSNQIQVLQRRLFVLVHLGPQGTVLVPCSFVGAMRPGLPGKFGRAP